MIVLQNIARTYSSGAMKVEALKNVNLQVERGAFIAIMGPSGSGKSTLMNLLGLLDQPNEGSYYLDGTDTRGMGEPTLAALRNSKIGFVFQNFNLLSRLNALRNVELPMIYAGLDDEKRRKNALQALDRVGLSTHIGHRPNEMSGGQQQRVAIARALVNNPCLVLADEPTGNLDSQSGNEIMAIFQELHRQGTTLVLVTHERNIALYAQKIAHFRDGQLIEIEQPGREENPQ